MVASARFCALGVWNFPFQWPCKAAPKELYCKRCGGAVTRGAH